MHRAHAQVVGHGKVAWVILKHCGLQWVQLVLGKDRIKSAALGLGQEARMLHAIDRIKQARQAACVQHTLGVGGAAIGIDDPPAR